MSVSASTLFEMVDGGLRHADDVAGTVSDAVVLKWLISGGSR